MRTSKYASHLVDEADVLARELAAGAGQRAQVGADEFGARRFQPARQLREQALGLAREVGGIAAAARCRRLGAIRDRR